MHSISSHQTHILPINPVAPAQPYVLKITLSIIDNTSLDW